MPRRLDRRGSRVLRLRRRSRSCCGGRGQSGLFTDSSGRGTTRTVGLVLRRGRLAFHRRLAAVVAFWSLRGNFLASRERRGVEWLLEGRSFDAQSACRRDRACRRGLGLRSLATRSSSSRELASRIWFASARRYA